MISTAMAFVAVGIAAGVLPLPLPGLLPEDNRVLIERLTEVTVVVALMGAGLAIDRPAGWRSWASTWRLLGLAMPLTIAAVALLGWGLLGLAPAAALLLAAALAPTDPVLAGEVRVAGPNSEDEDVVRRGLTSEAGLNDGLAFPFVYAAILLTGTGTGNGEVGSWILRWVAWDLVGRVLIGVFLGIAVGRAFAWLAFRKWPGLAESNEGILALSATFASYGLVEAAHGWGFIGVFVTGLTIRGYERDSRYHADLHEFSHQIERLLTMVALLMFGVACGSGLLAPLTWEALLVAVLLVVVIRPVVGGLSLIGCEGSWWERSAKAFFGVRGIAAFYYLAYGIGQAPFGDQELMWATASAAVLCSIVVHGVTAAPALRRLDSWRQREAGRASPSSGIT
ncbi:cation:proton antiporter [Nocardioides coralli]|nr:cation:proton antiporter [Nocardioides coralli]